MSHGPAEGRRGGVEGRGGEGRRGGGEGCTMLEGRAPHKNASS